MIRPKTTIIDAKATPLIADNTVRIRATSFVYENNWINFEGLLFNVTDYITNAVISPRTRFFTNRNYAVCLIVGLTKDGEVTVLEGPQVDYTKQTVVPFPDTFNIIPMVGVILVQDGTTDMINGFKPLNETNVTFFSGTGNVIDKNKPGDSGPDSDDAGHTGIQGLTGSIGVSGVTGHVGATGPKGRMVVGDAGDTGPNGMTGINWTIHVPFKQFF